MLACTGFSAVSPSACTARMNVVEVTPAWENTFLTLQPTFVVEDWAKARPLMAEFLDKTRTQRGAMYSGWTVCGDKLFCREAFAESAFLLEHLREVRPSLDALLAPGTAGLCAEGCELLQHGGPFVARPPKSPDILVCFELGTCSGKDQRSERV